MRQKEPFSCQRDGLTIRGHVFGRAAMVRPAVILSHGFLANQKMCYDYAALLADLGYVAFTFDFCGGGLGCSSDGRSADMTVKTELADLLAVLRHVRGLPYVQTERVSLLGCSQGGLVSMLAARAVPEQVERLLLFYPALCIPDDARKGRMMFYRFDPANIPAVLGRFPMKLGGNYAREVVDMDVMEQIGGFSGPVLYLHGTADKVVNIGYARAAVQHYPACQYHEIPGGGHMFRGRAEKEARQYLRAFMRNGIPGSTGRK
jgi:pimeloyl-ACP methyl ester carboxylesterase